jgi:FkbM family methyltransferase
MDYKGQLLQDKFIDNVLKQKRKGTYLDIGAHNGKDFSNTIFLEYERDWSGILIEPMEEEFERLKSCRGAHNLFFNTAVSDYTGETIFRKIVGGNPRLNMICGLVENLHPKHEQRIKDEAQSGCGEIVDIKVPVRTLQSILDECGMYSFDFCSLDVEGSELPILKSIHWERTDISIFIIENNYGVEEQITPYLEQQNYIRWGFLEWDVVYRKKDLF